MNPEAAPAKIQLSFDGEKFTLKDLSNAGARPSFYMPSGFYYDHREGFYVTRSIEAAERARMFADWSAQRALDKKFIRIYPGQRALPGTPPGLKLKAIQEDGIRFALARNRSYVAFDPGLGKTVVAAMVAAVQERAVVYLSPPSLIENVKNEFQTWAPRIRVETFGDKKASLKLEYANVLLIPDSLLSRPELVSTIRDFLGYWGEYEAYLIVDEAHRFKNDGAGRTKLLLGYRPKPTKNNPHPREILGIQDLFDRVLYLSGTPADNGLLDLFSILNKSAPETIRFMNRFNYAKYYCGAYHTEWGWKYDGKPAAGRAKELHKQVIHPSGPFMLRVRKKDSGIKFPPKIEELLVVSSKMSPALGAMDTKLQREFSEELDLIKKLITVKKENGGDEGDLHVAEYRRMLGEEKIKFAVEYTNSVLTETHENIILFGFHLSVIEGMKKGLKKWKPYVITGDTKVKDRQLMVNRFQSGDGRLFIGNYSAMGLGLTLTRADRVIFCEHAWNPSINDQASDRAHRIGRNDTVYVQYMVYQNSLDKRIVETVLRKREIIGEFEEK
jgi:SWI/SNF-related matrix-associated actin-dependent regulator 1 of chromatin subfamily A